VIAPEGDFSVVSGDLSPGEAVATSGIAALKAAWAGREEAK
jgi:hypothetical protein